MLMVGRSHRVRMVATANIRMPDEIYARLKARAQAEGRSINELAVEILDRESRRWAARRALEEGRRLREEIRARHGELPDSAPEIRRDREERAGGA